MHEGVIILNPQGNIQAVINKDAGLPDNDVKGIRQDEGRNIWCALNDGIGRIDYSSPLSFYHEKAGILGSISATIRHQGKLYVGTTSGLYVENTATAINQSLSFLPLESIRDQVWSLVSIRGQLLVGTNNGLYLFGKETSRRISDRETFTMYHSEKADLLLTGGSGGLAAFDPGQNWKMVKVFDDVAVDVKSIAENRSTPSDATEIWLGTSLAGTVKLLLDQDLSYRAIQYYGDADGLPEDWVLPRAHGDSVLFGTRKGILQFTDETEVRKMLPDSLKDLPDYYRGYFGPAEIFGDKKSLPLNFLVDTPGQTWAVIDNLIVLVPDDHPGEIIERPFLGIDLGKINLVYPDESGIAWIGAGDGLARLDLGRIDQPPVRIQAFIRSVTAGHDSLLFAGVSPAGELFPIQERGPSTAEILNMEPVLEYAHNDLTFSFTSPFFDRETRNRFSWMLVGKESGWTRWSDRRITGYTNLHEGSYEFLVRAQNIYGDVSEPASFTFTIRPPWFRTKPAYAAYLVLLGLLVYAAVRLGQLRLRRKNERLEVIIRQRTEEIRQQNIELAAQKKEITDSIYYAERIQRALLPGTGTIPEKIDGYFILFKPKDIVSGDFYWLAESGTKIIVTAVDCTGHGVPGAFMSMLGVSFLNKIILENNTLQADRILNDLRNNVVNSLKQTGKEGEARDGMDMALVAIDLEGMYMEFAGANNPLYLIRGNELNETKADRMPIAFQMEANAFTRHRIELTKGDTLYLFSDGYADQFGGPKGKKFMYKSFKRLLVDNQEKSIEEIGSILEETLEAWKAPDGEKGEVYEQVDDILVIGIRI
jgi:serine phosphatase RsbU (regulator of sigma subunit)